MMASRLFYIKFQHNFNRSMLRNVNTMSTEVCCEVSTQCQRKYAAKCQHNVNGSMLRNVNTMSTEVCCEVSTQCQRKYAAKCQHNVNVSTSMLRNVDTRSNRNMLRISLNKLQVDIGKLHVAE